MAVIHTKFTFFHPRGYGWTENWYKESTQPSLKRFNQLTANDFAQLRAGMLSATVTLETISCSFDPQPRGDSFLQYVNMTGQLPVNVDIPAQAGGGDTAWNGVLFQFRSTADQFRKAVFTRGQPDDVITQTGQLFRGPSWPAYQAAASAFIDGVIQGAWGWIRNIPSAKKKILDYAPDVVKPEFIVVTCAANTFPAPDPVVATFAKVRINYPNVRAEINGAWTVQVLSTSTCRIITPMAVFAPPSEDGTIVVYTPTFTPADNGDIQKATRRAPGRPLLRTPGRRGRRARG